MVLNGLLKETFRRPGPPVIHELLAARPDNGHCGCAFDPRLVVSICMLEQNTDL